METNEKKINIGCTTPGAIIIFLTFFCAKIFGYIDWSWWLIFAPLWIPLILCILVILVIVLIKIRVGW